MKIATEQLSQLKNFSDRITNEKEKVTKPLNEALKAERARWKPAETACEEAIEITRKKMGQYQTEQMRLAKIEEDKIADRVGQGKGFLKPETAAKKIDEIKRADVSVVADSGMVKFRTVKKFQIINESVVPRMYLIVNETAIRQAMLSGIAVEGVRYYEEQVPANFR